MLLEELAATDSALRRMRLQKLVPSSANPHHPKHHVAVELASFTTHATLRNGGVVPLWHEVVDPHGVPRWALGLQSKRYFARGTIITPMGGVRLYRGRHRALLVRKRRHARPSRSRRLQ
jgi:hypothetical protein